MSDFKVYNDIPRMMPTPKAPTQAPSGPASFGKLLNEAVQQVNDVEKGSQGELQKFLGTIHHTGSHKGFFVTTRTFSLAAEKFVAEHPIELIDGPRLVELVQEALGPGARREPEPAWF